MGRVYTRTGDKGTTHLGDNRVVPKDARRVVVSGTIDEATSALGVARSHTGGALADEIRALQSQLIRLMGRISLYDPDCPVPSAEEIERKIEDIRAMAAMPDVFVEPGESKAGGALHLARAIFRRAEREAVALAREEQVNPDDLRLINRLSDYVYALATWADYEERVARIARAVTERISSEGVGTGNNGVYGCGELSLDVAEALLAAMKRRAGEGTVSMAMAVCDAKGALVAFARQEGVLPVSVGLAQKKAFTAVQMRCPTADLAEATRPGAMLWGLQADPALVVFGGGIPLFHGQALAGAVGVSGGTVDEDVAVAQAALSAWNGA